MLRPLVRCGQKPVGPSEPSVGLGAVAAQPEVDGQHEGGERGPPRGAVCQMQAVRLAIAGDGLVRKPQPVRRLGIGVVVGGIERRARPERIVGTLPVPATERLVRLEPPVHRHSVTRRGLDHLGVACLMFSLRVNEKGHLWQARSRPLGRLPQREDASMAGTRRPASEVRQVRSEHEVWIDHAALTLADVEWLGAVRWLTLWDVTAPPGLLAALPDLRGVDWRGGSGSDLALVRGCAGLRCLVVNQVRGLSDLSELERLTRLDYLQLFGLKQVVEAPSLADHTSLRRLDIGVMRGLAQLGGLLDAPQLQELFLTKHVNVSQSDIARITTHPTLGAFGWFFADVPRRQWEPAMSAIDLPKAGAIRAEDWFREAGGLG